MRVLLVILLCVAGCERTRASPPPVAPPSPAPVTAPPVTPAVSAPVASPIPWSWSAEPDLYPLADLAVERGGARYTVSLTPGGRTDWKRPVTLRGPSWSVEVDRAGDSSGAAMVADDARVYVATYNRIAAGCRLAAFAASDGAPLWAVSLDGIGPIGHSKYSNRVQLRLIGGHPVVFGSEARRYIEERDATSGALRSHQLFDPARARPPIAEPLFHELDHMLASRASYTVGVDDFLARHVEMVGADRAARAGAFRDAVSQLDGRPIARGARRLRVELVDRPDRLEVRASRLAP